jgi:hypothetical protein
MSDLGQIGADLGEGLIFYMGIYPSVSIDGPSAVRTNYECTWSANISNGNSPFTYQWSGLFSGTSFLQDGIATTSGWLNLSITDYFGRSTNTALYVTVGPTEPVPPGCSV